MAKFYNTPDGKPPKWHLWAAIATVLAAAAIGFWAVAP